MFNMYWESFVRITPTVILHVPLKHTKSQSLCSVSLQPVAVEQSLIFQGGSEAVNKTTDISSINPFNSISSNFESSTSI